MNCGCGLTPEQKERNRFRSIASRLPLIKGTIIKEDGTKVNLSTLFDIPEKDLDAQLAKAQNIFPYIRDTIILEDGRTCSLFELLSKVVEELKQSSVVYSDETRFIRQALTEEDWINGD